MPLLSITAATGQSGDVRIVNLTSDGHNYAPKEGIRFNDVNLEAEASMRRYGQSKLANILHSNQLHLRYGPDSGTEAEIWTAAVHPGHIDT
jgi:NAD(P)-dependent dehydrogenase (short-subunit alcohol dehydrogenase family)